MTDNSRIDVGLISGGKDSVTAVHYTHTEVQELDLLAYLDTTTGAQKNREYIEQVADSMGVQLWTLRTNENYDDAVKKESFPGPSRHFIYYNLLKNRQISKLATVCYGKELHLWNGARKQESKRRMGNVEKVEQADRWVWHSPIHDWSKSECEDYISDNDIPESELWSTLGRSSDCFCGCFGSPEELIDAEAAGLDDVVEQMRGLEDEIDADDEKDIWGWGGMSGNERRAERVDDDQMTLCSTCAIGNLDTSSEE